MNSKQKGSLAVAQAISQLTALGYEVSLPLGDRMPYDLIVDANGKLLKVQVKYAGVSPKGKYIAYLRTTGGNQSFNYARKYNDDDFDVLYIYTENDRHFMIEWKAVNVRNAITICHKKYSKFEISTRGGGAVNRTSL